MKKFVLAAVFAVTNANVYSQEGSAPPPKLYKCEAKSFKCVECEEHELAGCNYETACTASCGKFTPDDMLGMWRGFVVKDGGVD